MSNQQTEISQLHLLGLKDSHSMSWCGCLKSDSKADDVMIRGSLGLWPEHREENR